MHSDYEEEQKPVKMEFIEDYSENKSDPEPFIVKQKDTEEQRGWCLFFVFH